MSGSSQKLRVGFAKNCITPRVGVELCGFGPYQLRKSIGVRDRLWARAMAMELGGKRMILVSCDIILVTLDITRKVRQIVSRHTGIDESAVMIVCSHTHSGPSAGGLRGWGEADGPYVETLPQRIAKACVEAVASLKEATVSYCEGPCEGVGLNREYDKDAPPLDEVLKDDWRPAKPELTDTTCHVLTVHSEGRLIGFVSYFGCHPVVCCDPTRHIHGDYAGVATNLLERENPGSVGLFLQGAQGDVNSCCVHKPEMESLLALDVIASRYANAVRKCMQRAGEIEVDSIGHVEQETFFSSKPWDAGYLRELLNEKESALDSLDVDDTDWSLKLNIVCLQAIRDLIVTCEKGEPLIPATEIQGMKIGPISILGSGFEIFQAIKNEVVEKSSSPITLVTGLTNDGVGYAPDKTAAARGGYAADQVPLMMGRAPYANIHEELVEALLSVEKRLRE